MGYWGFSLDAYVTTMFKTIFYSKSGLSWEYSIIYMMVITCAILCIATKDSMCSHPIIKRKPEKDLNTHGWFMSIDGKLL